MSHRPRRRVILGALALALCPFVQPLAAEDATPRMPRLEDIQADIDQVPCEDSERLAAVRAMYERAGAAPADIHVEAFGDVENLVVVKPGSSPERIVIGAHYDKVREGCGAVDNWTGQVALTRLYRTVRDVHFNKTLVFVAFGREEKGLVGSRAMAKAIPDDQLAGYCAMVNIDSLGLGPPQVADNMSGGKLGALAGDLAKEMEIPFAHASIGRANSDSSSFVARRIPAVTLHGLNNQWTRVLHTQRDKASRVDPASVYLGYRLALAMIVRVDQSPCDRFR